MFSGLFRSPKPTMVKPEDAVPGSTVPTQVNPIHFVKNTPTIGPFPEQMEIAVFAMGCFWGAERRFWQQDGVFSTQVGYGGGYTTHPTYKEVCSGRTGHTEVVQVVYDPDIISYAQLLKVFWEAHDPTQGHRQGNDVGTQYRSAIYTTTEAQMEKAVSTRDTFQAGLSEQDLGEITTELKADVPFFYAEDYHQQYLGKNPGGYCGLRGTGVSCAL